MYFRLICVCALGLGCSIFQSEVRPPTPPATLKVATETQLQGGCAFVGIFTTNWVNPKDATNHVMNQAVGAGSSHVVLGDYSRNTSDKAQEGTCGECVTFSAKGFRCEGAALEIGSAIAAPLAAEPTADPFWIGN